MINRPSNCKKMEHGLLPLYVLLCLETVLCNTASEQVVPPVSLNGSNVGSDKVQAPPTKDDCVKLFHDTFEFEATCKLARKKFNDDLRCLLIGEIGDSICSSEPRFDPKSCIRNVSALCEQEFPRNKTGNPTIVTMFLELWNSPSSTANCGSICALNGGQYHSICYFIFDYYKVPLPIGKLKPDEVPAKSRPSANNDEGAAKSEALAANAPHEAQNGENESINDSVGDEPQELAPPAKNADTENKQNVNPESANANDDLPGLDVKEDVGQPETLKDEHASRNDKDPEENHEKKTSTIQSKRTEPEVDSHVSFYFMLVSGVCIMFYFMMYNKKKILALVIEGRRRNVKRRPNSAAYSKLDCNLEEAMASGPSTSTSATLQY